MSWRNLNHYSKIGVDGFALPTVAVAPWFFTIFIPPLMYVLIPYSLVISYCHFKKIRFNRLMALIRRKLIGGEYRRAYSHRHTTFAVLIVALFGLFSPQKASAEFELIDMTGSSYAPVSSGLPNIRFHRVRGYGHETPLRAIMQMSTPDTWQVRFLSPELASMKIDVRADNVLAEEFYRDLSARYGLKFVYGDSTGVLNIDWSNPGCKSNIDPKTKINTICG
ncbi:hypothetical protein ACEUAI_18740 [Aeromonas veronii]